MKVEPTGIVMAGECEIQGPHCTAKNQLAAITAVWGEPSRRQINVCRNCLDDMIRSGDWQVAGATIETRADIEVARQNGPTILVVEVKRVPPIQVDRETWAVRVRRNLLAHAAIPRTRYFLLAAWPGPFYLWTGKENQPEAPPDFHVKVDNQVKAFLAHKAKGTEDERVLIEAIARWLVSLAKSKAPQQPAALRKSGLANELLNATIRINPTPYGGKAA